MSRNSKRLTKAWNCVIFSKPYINHLHRGVEALIYIRKLRECNENLITSMGGRS